MMMRGNKFTTYKVIKLHNSQGYKAGSEPVPHLVRSVNTEHLLSRNHSCISHSQNLGHMWQRWGSCKTRKPMASTAEAARLPWAALAAPWVLPQGMSPPSGLRAATVPPSDLREDEQL
ncbi:hypothetical protein Q9966_012315 [Columba livia]|nr:hypothetical protein Q9966_012315 [Columba livia]